MTRLGAPSAVAAMAIALGLFASPDLPLPGMHGVVCAIVAVLTAVFVVAVLDRRAPRRLVALGVATVAIALGYDALRADRGTITLAEGQGTPAFERQEASGRASTRPLGPTIVLESVAPDGSVVLARAGEERRLRVSPRRAATVSGYRLGQPRRPDGGDAVPGRPVTLSVTREPAAPLAGLGLLIAALGVAWSRW